MPVSFDDLIPAQPQAAPRSAGLSFDDLIPQGPAASATYDPSMPRLGMSGDGADPSDVSTLTTGGVGPDGRLVNELSASGFAKGADAAVGAVARGIPFQDRAGAAISAATGLGGHFGDYSGALADMRAVDARQKAEHPGGEVVGNLVGGAMVPLGVAGNALRSASLAGKVAGGAAVGAGFGAAQGASNAPDWTDVPETADAVTHGARDGALVGGFLPAFGSTAGGLFSLGSRMAAAPIPGYGRTASNLIQPLINPKVTARLDALGPDAILADASPSLNGLAGGVVIKPGAGADTLVDTITARHAGQSDRLLTDRNAALGPAVSPLEFKAGIDARQAATGPAFERALDGMGPVDISPVVQQLDRGLGRAIPGGQEAAALQQARSFITRPAQAPQWEVDPIGSGRTPEPPPGFDFAPTDNGVRGAAPRRPDVPQPQTLHQFVRSLGGVQDPRGDLTAMGLADIPGLVARPGKGLGPDAVRQVAAEAGYLGPQIDDAMANTSINDLFDAMASERPVFSVRDQGAVDAWDRYGVARDAWQRQGAPNSAPAGPRSFPASDYPELVTPPTHVPIDDPRLIQKAKQELDDHIAYQNSPLAQSSSAVKSQQGAYQSVRRGLNEALEGASPEFAAANRAYADAAKDQRAFDTGRKSLGDGDEWPRDLSVRWDATPAAQQAAERAGMRSDIEQRFGTSRHDLNALAQALGDGNDFSRAKIGTVFGEDGQSALVRMLDRERTFADTNTKVVQGSQSAQRLGASKLVEDNAKAPEPMLPKNLTWAGLAANLGETAVRKTFGAVASRTGGSTREQLGRLLSLSGPELEAAMKAAKARGSVPPASAAALAAALGAPSTTTGLLASRQAWQ